MSFREEAIKIAGAKQQRAWGAVEASFLQRLPPAPTLLHHLTGEHRRMVLEAAVHTITSIGVARLLPWFAAAVGLYILRTWAKGFTCREERNLNNKTFVLIGGFSGPGLSLFRSLASRGAQVIALHPTPSSPHILQLILLLRSSTSNERLYADECDMLDLASVRSFVKRWEKDARSGMVNDLEARIEGIIFCDGEGSGLDGNEGMGVGRILAQHPTNDELALERYHTALLLSRHALVQLLLPTILRSAANTPVRIINQISPFYAASALDLNDLDYVTRPYPDWEPWLVEGQASLGSIALFRELQLRVDEQRKPGSGGLVIVSVCGGFTRAWARRTLRANFDNERFSWIGFAVHFIAFPLIFWLMKSAEEASQGLLGAVLGNVRRRDVPDIVGEEKANEDEEKNRVLKGKARGKREEKVTVPLRGGAVYREGVEIRIQPLEVADPNLPVALWEIESRRVERIVAVVAAEEAKATKEKEIVSKGRTEVPPKKKEEASSRNKKTN